MSEIGGGVVVNLTSTAIIEVVKYLKNASESEKDLQFLITDLNRMEVILSDIHKEFEYQQKTLPPVLQDSLESMKNVLLEAKDLVDRAERQRRRCFGWCVFFNPNLLREIKEWKNSRFNQLSQQLDSALSRAAHIPQIVGPAHSQAEVLLQPLPESGFVGSGIVQSAQKLLTWLNEPAQVIGVYGMAGVGKTSLLQLIYNHCKQKVSGNFDAVIWFTVSQNYDLERLQYSIAEVLNLNLEQTSTVDTRKMKLYASLKNKKCLLILDDVWRRIDLNEVGVHFGHHNSSKVLISSRYRDVIEIMAENEYCMKIQPLSTEEGWDLFRRRAFTNGVVRDNTLETIARKVASECKGLPLAINTVAAALARKKNADEWNRALVSMTNVDPSFPIAHKTIDAELYQRLRLSYNDLRDNLKMCFLYCAAFPEDTEIDVETLVEMWTAEGLLTRNSSTYFMDVGREYMDILVDRCLIEYVDMEKEEIKIHDVLRDMAIYIGQEEENWLFLASQDLQNFPKREETRDRKRISVFNNKISHLPEYLKCPTPVSLMLAENRQLNEIPKSFLVSFVSLKILDLSYTSIQALPISVGQLGQLEFLNLRGCDMLNDLPESICDLSDLQFLNLEDCTMLNSVPDRIGELQNLKHLKFSDHYGSFRVIPHQICLLTSLNKLVFHFASTPMSLEDLTNLSNLIELNIRVKPEIKKGSMSTWSKMRKLTLWFDENRGDVTLDIHPHNMQNMRLLQVLHLYNYLGVSLPNCICQFQNLKILCLFRCSELKELPALEFGSGFPMLERLELSYLNNLQSIVWNEETMLKLQSMEISGCPGLKTLRMKNLPNLRDLVILDCDQLKELYIESGSFPMLETLKLNNLPNLDSIVVPSNMWNEGTMPRLQFLQITGCTFLRRLSLKELPILKEIRICNCDSLEIEIGSFPSLEGLTLIGLEKLKTFTRLWNIWNENTMPQTSNFEDHKLSLVKETAQGNGEDTSSKRNCGKIKLVGRNNVGR